MRITYITAGAAGMFCGSCMKDNTLVAALARQGHDALLVPCYTPIRTDEEDISQKRIFFGGINVYLQQKWSLFRHTPWLLDRLLDAPSLLRYVSKFAVKTRAEDLGDLTISMLKGEHGHQKKEIDKLVQWLASDFQPQIINLTNVLLSGLVHDLNFAARLKGSPQPLSTLFYLPPDPNVAYSAVLMSKVENMFLTGKPPYPVERTLLTTGLVAAGMQSLASGQKRLETPHLNIRYEAPRESSFARN